MKRKKRKEKWSKFKNKSGTKFKNTININFEFEIGKFVNNLNRESMTEKLKSLADEKLRKFNYEYDQFFIDEIVQKLTDEDIQVLVKEITEMKDTQKDFDRVKEIIDNTKDANIKRIKQQQMDLLKKEEAKNVKREWSQDEYSLLVKALNKYPGGTPDRWKTIAGFMGGDFTSKDIIEMTGILTQKKAKFSAKKAAKKEAEKTEKEGTSKGKKIAPEEDWTDEEQK